MNGTMTEAEWQQVLWLLAPWLIGAFVDFLLQGILFSQFASYFSWYKEDKGRLRCVVAILLVLTTLKSMQAFLIVWKQNIVHFSDVAGAVALSYTSWWQTGNGLMVASIGIYVQSYFCFRLYVITHRIYYVVPIATILVFAYIASIMSVYYSVKSNTKQIGHWYAAHLSAAFAGDTLLAGTTAYALITAKSKYGLKQTNDILQALVHLTWQTITPAALCAFLNLVFSQVYNGEKKLVSAAFNMALPKLYAISMMWTLNARRSIRIAHSSGNMTSSGDYSGRPRRRGDVELGRFGTLGTIHIRTDIETLQYTDQTISDAAFGNSKGDVGPVSSRRSDESQHEVQSEAASYKARVV